LRIERAILLAHDRAAFGFTSTRAAIRQPPSDKRQFSMMDDHVLEGEESNYS